MRRLSPRVNVIPVIGKADSMTLTERQEFKKRIMEDIEHYGIPVYNFPYDVEEDDEETIADNSELRGLMPFAIVGSEEDVPLERTAGNFSNTLELLGVAKYAQLADHVNCLSRT